MDATVDNHAGVREVAPWTPSRSTDWTSAFSGPAQDRRCFFCTVGWATAQPSVAAAMHERILGSKLVVGPDAGHLSHVESPDRFNAEVRGFIRGLVS